MPRNLPDTDYDMPVDYGDDWQIANEKYEREVYGDNAQKPLDTKASEPTVMIEQVEHLLFALNYIGPSSLRDIIFGCC